MTREPDARLEAGKTGLRDETVIRLKTSVLTGDIEKITAKTTDLHDETAFNELR